MEKRLFHEEYEKIDVPREDVLQAIKTGVRKAGKVKNPRKARVIASTAAAAVILLSSSFMSPSLSKVMADVPVVGQLYVQFNDAVGRSLASQELITKLNETASNNGIDVSITSAYYDGAVIGVTFNVKGNVKTIADGQLMGVYEIFDGDVGIADSKEVVYMKPTEGGFSGQIQLNYPRTELPVHTTFPLEFKRLGDQSGSWKFNVPIKQLDYKTIITDSESARGDVAVHFDSIISGKASTVINYTATYPKGGQHDQIRLEVFDDKGEPVHLLSDGIDLETKKVRNQILFKGRTIIPQALSGKTAFLEIHPLVALFAPDQFVSLNSQTSNLLMSPRQNLSVAVENISVKDKSVTVDFQVNNGEKGNRDFMFFQDFARNDVTLVKETQKDVYEKPLKHSIKVLDKGKLRFRSTFDLSGVKDFHADEFVVRVSMNSLSANMPFELNPIKIDLR
ncbi:DUF4179 domain-containing protein [Neobacillus rhizosphaerae]|uniref:DUF4179 domain-containing protein n=1 Tax=Neobacillus rhizosphaerae TaxID=2880965 RepID=UPI003D2925A5